MWSLLIGTKAGLTRWSLDISPECTQSGVRIVTGANEQILIDRIMESWEVPLRGYLKSTPLRAPASVLLSHLAVRDSQNIYIL